MRKSLKNIVPMAHLFIRESVLEKGNVAGVKGSRARWAKDMKFSEKPEYTFFAGCGYHSMRYLEGMARAAKGMKWAGIDLDKSIGLNLGMGKFFRKFGVDLSSLTGRLFAEGNKETYTGMLVSAVQVLQKLGLEVGYLFEKEPCCGSPLDYFGIPGRLCRKCEQGLRRVQERRHQQGDRSSSGLHRVFEEPVP